VSLFRRRDSHALPPLVDPPKVADLPQARLESGARYLGTTVAGAPSERVRSHGLSSRGAGRIRLSQEGLDVIRLAGPFRIPLAALRGARHEPSVRGREVPPNGVLMVTWQHGDLVLDSAFRLSDLNTDHTPVSGSTAKQSDWVRKISKLVRKDVA
jgi:hypothetical protein